MKQKHEVKSLKFVYKAAIIFMAVITAFTALPNSRAQEKYDRVEITIDLNYEYSKSSAAKLLNKEFNKSYYYQLSKVEKEIYNHRKDCMDIIRDGTAETIVFPVESKILVDDFLEACVNALSAYDYDHPEKFWASRKMHLSATYNTETLRVVEGEFMRPEGGWYINAYSKKSEVVAAEKEFNARVKEVVSGAKGSVYDKVLYFHDWLINNNTYNEYVANGNSNRASDLAWCAASALIGDPNTTVDDPVCEGYSRAFKLLCNKASIPCVLAVGLGNGGGHMWNYVKMHNGLWYAVDVTWDDPISDTPVLVYNHFLKGSASFFERHTEDGYFIPGYGKFSYPALCEYDYPTELGGLLGDVRGDGKIDVGGATLILRSVAGIYEIPVDRRPYADLNCNGDIETGDAVIVLRYVIGANQ